MVGREEELSVVERFLAAVENGSARALLVEGEPGIGKTTLWQAATAAAEDAAYTVLRCRPAESEFQLSYAGLGDLLDPILAETLPALPPPQRRALKVALLLDEARDRPPDPRAVALAVAAALRAFGGERQTLLAVDDAQWLDTPSAAVLEFALRRLGGCAVKVLATIRLAEGKDAPLRLDRAVGSDAVVRLPLGPLSLGALETVVRSRLHTPVSRHAMLRLHEGSGGNPFYALEIAGGVLRHGGRLEGAQPLPLPHSLRELVREHLAGLTPESQDALLIASALRHARVSLVEAAWDGPSSADAALAGAVAAGVAEMRDGEVAFAHPLLRSAAYSGADPQRRRAVHRRLAELVADPEQRAHHLALATVEPDANVVDELEGAAHRAWLRGAPDAAAELTEHALLLSPAGDGPEHAERRMWAAHYHFQAGGTRRARELLEKVVASGEGRTRALALHALGIVAYHDDSTTTSAALLARALDDAGDNAVLQTAILRDLAWSVATNGDVPGGVEHAHAAIDLTKRSKRMDKLAETLAVAAFTEFLAGSPWALEQVEHALALGEVREHVPIGRRPTFVRAWILKYLDRLDEARTALEALHEQAVERGEESVRPFLLAHLCELECWAGNWELAAAHGAEAHDLAVFTGQRLIEAMTSYAMALVDAHRGRIDTAVAAAEAGLGFGRRGGVTPIVQANATVLGFVELSLGHAASADAHLGPLARLLEDAGMREAAMWRFLPDEIEALVALGRLDEAVTLLDTFEGRALARERGWACATAARCRGLVAAARGDLAGALSALESAVAIHERVPVPFDRARTLLALGTTQLRANHKREARASLTAAHAIFEELGAPRWAATAQADLRRIGGRPGAGAELTPSEERVAALVAAGRTNREVAAQLYVTVGTVEGHLSRIYDKLGVRSRTELAHRFRETAARVGG